MNNTTIGLGIAKNVFQVLGVDAHGKVVLRKQLSRAQVPAFFANLPRSAELVWKPVLGRTTGRGS